MALKRIDELLNFRLPTATQIIQLVQLIRLCRPHCCAALRCAARAGDAALRMTLHLYISHTAEERTTKATQSIPQPSKMCSEGMACGGDRTGDDDDESVSSRIMLYHLALSPDFETCNTPRQIPTSALPMHLHQSCWLEIVCMHACVVAHL